MLLNKTKVMISGEQQKVTQKAIYTNIYTCQLMRFEIVHDIARITNNFD